MAKRKSVDVCEHIRRKIRKLERKLRRKRRKERSDSRCASVDSEYSTRNPSESSLYQQGNEIGDQAVWTENDENAQNTILLPLETNGVLSSPGQSKQLTNIPSLVTVPPPPPPPRGRSLPASPSPPDDAQPPTGFSQPAAACSSTGDTTATPETENLDTELLDILGIDPTSEKKYGKEVNNDLSIRLQHWVTNGLSKEMNSQLKEKYLTPENCKLIDAPALNAEIKAAVSETIIRRDIAIESKQKLLTCAMTSLGEAITFLLSSKGRDPNLLKLLMDSIRILAECQHVETSIRRNFLLHSVKSELKDHLQNTKVDTSLFGENLHEVLKSAKAINKTGTEIKLPPQKVANKKRTPNSFNSKNLNSKNPGPTRRRTGPPRMKEPATTSTRSRHTSSYRQSQRRQQRDRQSYRR